LQAKANRDTADVRMADICKRVPSSDSSTEERIDVVFFEDLPEKFISILPRLSDSYKSSIFQGIWKRSCKSAYRERQSNSMLEGGLTLLEVQEKVWQPSIEKWEQLAQTVYDGSIHLKDIDRNFRNIVMEEDLKNELKIMFATVSVEEFTRDRTAAERVSRIHRYRDLQKHIQAAETVWKFKEALGLTGDFSIVEQLRNQVSLLLESI
jgi:hypothetical protein